MDIEPLPKVTFLPAQLTELVIKNWTGDIIDYEKNGQICKVYHGQGTCQFRDGHTFKGELRHGLLHGKGTFKWTDGTLYKGEFKNNEITGQGRYQWPDQSWYEGTVKNGLRDGIGKYVNPKEEVEYQGEWLDGMRHGKGTLTYKNGSVYEGEWQRGMKWGHGKMTYSSQNYYEGQWSNNKRNGQGTMYWLSSDEKYEGNWEDNFQSGFGAHIWLDGTTENKLLRNRYVGYWKLGQRCGLGTFYYSNGSQYEGEWKDNYKHGQGIFTFEDGSQYIGPFDQDRMVKREIPLKDVQQTASQNLADQKDDGKSKNDKSKTDTKTSKSKVKSESANTVVKPVSKTTLGQTQLSSNQNSSTANKFNQQSKNKKEVEENPYKKLVDLTDLIELETNGEETLKEVQNILLRHNSEMKSWYREYSRNIEATNSEESFAMTLKQVWRFLRDTHIISGTSTIAQFNRVFNQGAKNHFSLLGSQDKKKFDKKYGNLVDNIIQGKKIKQFDQGNISDEEAEDLEELQDEKDQDVEDNHESSKIVLQRQFFDSIARAAAVKFASGINCQHMPNLQLKLEYLFRNNYLPLAVENESKTVQEVNDFNLADKIFEKNKSQLQQIFKYFSQKQDNLFNGRKDETIFFNEIQEMLQNAKILDGGKSTNMVLEEVIFMIEKYYDPETKLQNQISREEFEKQFKQITEQKLEEKLESEEVNNQLENEENNNETQPVNEGEAENQEDLEEKKAKEEAERTEHFKKWRDQKISAHLVYIKGVELVFYEFKELLFQLAIRLREYIDGKPEDQPNDLVQKFLDNLFLKRLVPFIKFNQVKKQSLS